LPDKSIKIILEYMGKALNGERTYIVEKNKLGGDDNTYEWVAVGVTPEIDNLQNLPPEVCASWYQSFSKNKNIVIENVESIKNSDPLKYEILKRQNINSIVVVPLYDDNKIIGFYGVDNPPMKNLDYALDMLQIVGHFIISTLRRRNIIKQLHEMSCSDQLTKIGNRYAMNEFISNIRQGESIGVVYCDITGLKRVNDSEGHEAGDKLICICCECIKAAFGNYSLFRIGGDEFLVLCVQIDEAELNERVQLLKRESEKNSVVIATGAVWSKNDTSEIQTVISKAEKLMYEDKSAYYKSAGIDRRR
jgi:diguanylate cyclase (GGDEF)-like protein